jgi:hypothetical protein
MRELTDAAWAEICAAAANHSPPLTPDEGTRAELSAVLFSEYPGMRYDRQRVAVALRRAERMLRNLAAFATDHRAQFTADDVRTEADRWFLEMLRRRPLATWLACRALRRANKGHQNSQREWFVSRLSGIWLDSFHAPRLTVSVPATGGPPGGPLIEFMLAAMRQVMPEPRRESLRDAIDRERRERENAKQLWLELKQREAETASTLKKDF